MACWNFPDVISDLDPYISTASSWIHPGHFFLATSLPFCWSAYRGYQTPLEGVVQSVLKHNKSSGSSLPDLSKAEEHVRKAVGSAVASRALWVATSASIGGFGILTASLFYLSGCHSVEQAISSTRHWAHSGRRRVDNFFGIDRVDKDHPEYLLTQSMSEEEELEFVSKKYLPDEEWVIDDQKDGSEAEKEHTNQ